jgi:hypothetical protein
MDSSRQAIHEGTKALCVCLLKALANSSTQWKGALYARAGVKVNFRYFMMASKCLWDIKWLKWKDAPKKMSTSSVDQNSFLEHPCVVPISSMSARNLMNSGNKQGGTISWFICSRRTSLMKSTGKNAGRVPRCHFLLPYQCLSIQPYNYSGY